MAARGLLLLVLGGMHCGILSAQIVRTTLLELVKQSPIIFLGHIHERADGPAPASSDDVIDFDVTQAFRGLKGTLSTVAMCNHHPNSEWPNLTTLKGDQIIFAEQKGNCLELTMGYRSAVTVADGLAHTSGITGEASRQPVASFSERVRALAMQKTQAQEH
jgi:hypothetical protein